MLPLAIGAIALGTSLAGCGAGGDVESPKLSMDDIGRNQPGPRATTLHLVAGDVEGCSEGETEVLDVNVDESGTEVVVDASLRTGSSLLSCEIRTVRDSFEVTLDRPLGERHVIDDSRGEHAVIWSPELRQEVVRAKGHSLGDARRAVLAAYPGTHRQSCARFGVGLFKCTTRYPGMRRIFLDVVVLPTGELEVRPDTGKGAIIKP